MSDRDALLAAIRANPDDDTPRLVFADWLDENEPDAKPRAKKGKKRKAQPQSPSSWAALIRAQCEFERLRRDGSAAAAVFNYFAEKDERTLNDVRWERVLPEVIPIVELQKSISGLWKASRKAREAGLPKLGAAGWWRSETHRGFADGLQVSDGGKMLARLPALVEAVPRLAVAFPNTDPVADPDALVAAGLSRLCRDLLIFGDGSHDKLVAAMSRSPDTAGVHSLMCRWSLEDQTARILGSVADSPHWSSLRELTIDATFTMPADLPRRLFGAAHLRGLTRLTVYGGTQMSAVAAALGGLGELRTLSLTGSNLDDDDAVQLANMPALANVRWLDLTHNRITGRGAAALLASRHLRNLAVLDFEGNPIRSLDRAALAGAPRGGLRALNLQSARLTATDLTTITSSPRASELMYFAACYNPFPESAVARLVKGFGDRAPAVLYLMGNNIRTAGAEALANWPAAEQIDMLHLSGNTLSIPGARKLAGCQHLQQLNHLCADVGHSTAKAVLKKQFGDRAVV